MNLRNILGLVIIGGGAILVFAFILLGGGKDEDSTKDTPAAPQVGIIINIPEAQRGGAEGFFTDLLAGFMAERGYVRGESITFELALAQNGSLIPSTETLIATGADVVIAWGPEGYDALRAVSSDTPTVILLQEVDFNEAMQQRLAEDPNATLIIFSAAHERRLEILLEIAPDIEQLFVFHSDEDLDMMAAIERIAPALNITVVDGEFNTPNNAQFLLETMPDNIDAIFAGENSLPFRTQLVEIALARQIPLSLNSVVNFPGVLMGYGTDLPDGYIIAARLVDQILQGTRAGDLPAEFVEPRLFISLGSAEAIGITVPESVLQQASSIATDALLFIPPAEAETEGYCNAVVVTQFGEQQVCVTTICDNLTDSAATSYTERETASTCRLDNLVGICETAELRTYFYDGDDYTMASGCAFQGGRWLFPTRENTEA